MKKIIAMLLSVAVLLTAAVGLVAVAAAGLGAAVRSAISAGGCEAGL